MLNFPVSQGYSNLEAITGQKENQKRYKAPPNYVRHC